MSGQCMMRKADRPWDMCDDYRNGRCEDPDGAQCQYNSAATANDDMYPPLAEAMTRAHDALFGNS